ncbi:MAG TPA: hypothetical protein VFW23_04210 [Tepidisphaeraceae bacterium]|nr:hypothetical protein [Tepidisphaeraceae bacterium]
MKFSADLFFAVVLFGTFAWSAPAPAGAPASTRTAATQPARNTEIWIKGEQDMYSWGNLQPAVLRIYRDPPSKKPLEVYFRLGGDPILGRIISGNMHDRTDVRQPPDMDYYLGDNIIPVGGDVYKVIIPAGKASVAFELKPVYQRKMRAGGTFKVDLLRPQPETRPSPQTRPTTRPAGGK